MTMAFGIREFGSAMRGAGDAAVYHEEAQRRRSEEEFRKKQRARQEKEWKDTDDEQARVDRIAKPGQEYEEPAPLGEDETGPPQARKGIQTRRRYMDQVAAAMKDPIKGIQVTAQADQFDDAEFNRHNRKVNDYLMKARRLSAMGDHVGAMRIFKSAYDLDNDGYKIIMQDGHWGIAGPDAKFVQPPRLIDKQSIEELTDKALEYTSMDNWKAFQERNYRKALGDSALRRTAVDEANAPIQRDLWGAQAQHARDTGRAALQNAGTQASNAAMGRMGSPISLAGPKGEAVPMVPVMGKDGKITFIQPDLPPGYTFPKESIRVQANAQFMAAAKDDPTLLTDPEKGRIVMEGIMQRLDPTYEPEWAKVLKAGRPSEVKKQGGKKAPAPAPAPAPSASPAPAATADPLASATPAQLFAAVVGKDPLARKFATEELRRRGLVGTEQPQVRGHIDDGR